MLKFRASAGPRTELVVLSRAAQLAKVAAVLTLLVKP